MKKKYEPENLPEERAEETLIKLPGSRLAFTGKEADDSLRRAIITCTRRRITRERLLLLLPLLMLAVMLTLMPPQIYRDSMKSEIRDTVGFDHENIPFYYSSYRDIEWYNSVSGTDLDPYDIAAALDYEVPLYKMSMMYVEEYYYVSGADMDMVFAGIRGESEYNGQPINNYIPEDTPEEFYEKMSARIAPTVERIESEHRWRGVVAYAVAFIGAAGFLFFVAESIFPIRIYRLRKGKVMTTSLCGAVTKGWARSDYYCATVCIEEDGKKTVFEDCIIGNESNLTRRERQALTFAAPLLLVRCVNTENGRNWGRVQIFPLEIVEEVQKMAKGE